MKSWLYWDSIFLLWIYCSSQRVCEEPLDIDFGEIVSKEKDTYLENDRVQYRCNPGYVLEGSEWILCNGQDWIPSPPKCLAPCSITKRQLVTENLFLFGGRRRNQVIQSNHSLIFQCSEEYILTLPSVRKCVDGHMDLPLCISRIGGNCISPPRIENGDIITLPKQQYRSGSSVEFKCQNNYAMEGQNRSFCDNGTWTKVPNCLEMTCNPPRISNGSFRPQRTKYHDGDLIQIQCDHGFNFEPGNGEKVVECTRNGWSPSPKCVTVQNTCQKAFLLHGFFVQRQQHTQVNEEARYVCYDGYTTPEGEPEGKTRCLAEGWNPEPKCIDVSCPPPPQIAHGQINNAIKRRYLPQEKVSYRCHSGYSLVGPPFVTCLKKNWTETPLCSDIGGKCGRPPVVENADIRETSKLEYSSHESVTYQCQLMYRMEGFARVTCQNGHWSQLPTCTVPCTASEEDMRKHNLKLRWKISDKIHSEDGNMVEFECKRGYQPDPNSRPFRVPCVEGKFHYPHCINL